MNYNQKNIVFGGDFNLIFHCKFDASAGNPILKKKCLAKLIEIKETPYLCGIWRIRNPDVKSFTFGRTMLPVSLNEGLIFF